MLKIINLIAVLSLSLISVTAQEMELQNWSFSKEIIIASKPKEYSSVLLDIEVYKNLNFDLNSIRIVDNADNFIPYYIMSVYTKDEIYEILFESKKINTSQHELTQLEYEQSNPKSEEISIDEKRYKTIYDFQILPSEESIRGNRLQLIIKGEPYSKQVGIWGRNEKSDWINIGTDTIYNFDGFKKTEIDLESEQYYNFYRLVLFNNTDQINITSLTLINDLMDSNTKHLKKKVNLNYEITTEGKKSTISLQNDDNLKIRNLLIETEGIYKRRYSLGGVIEKDRIQIFKTGKLYNFQFKKTHIESNKIELENHFEVYDRLRLYISNEDNPPINIINIQAEYLIDKIIFSSKKNAKYRLLFGNQNAEKPVYDIEEFKEYISEDDISEAKLDKLLQLKEMTEIESKEFPFQIIFNILIVIIAVALTTIILVKLKPSRL